MIDRDRRAQLLAAKRAREGRVDEHVRRAELCDRLRSFYYPKQAAFYRSKHRRRATNKTRRSGATAGGCRELVARALETPRFRAVYVTTTRIEAKARAWLNDTESGFVDILRKYGVALDDKVIETVDMCGVQCEIRSGELALVFSNGSLIELFGADDEGAINKLRGRTKHVWWVDEAQDFTWLERLYKAVISAGSTDFAGEVWLTGTPSVDCAGFFYEVTRDDTDGLPGWEVHRIAVVDNPFFGRPMWQAGQWYVIGRAGIDDPVGPFADEAAAESAAIQLRWDRTAGEAIRENKWDDDDPDLLREWFARWVKEGARYVYALHSVIEQAIVYAPCRLGVDGFPDLQAAMLDLPGAGERDYFTSLGADLGTRDAFAFVVWTWSLKDPILYELASWKKTGLDYDEMAAYLHAVRAQINLSMIVADAGGGGKPAVMGWSKSWVDRYQIPITEAKKAPGYKPIAIKQMNNDIRQGWIRLRKDSPLMAEWRVHRWSPLRSAEGKEVEDPKTPNHCADGALYSHIHSYHHRYRPEPAKVLPGTPEWVLREEQELESTALAPIQGPYGYR